MATVALAQTRWRAERRFYSGMALALLAATFIGFAPTYYLASYFAAPPLGPLVHVHGILFSAWILLFLAQTSLVAAGRTDLHRRMGVVGLAVGIAIIVLGLALAIESGRLGNGPPDRDQRSFLIFPFVSIGLFAGFAGTALWQRRRSEHHKRLMLLATVAMVVPALARISRMLELPFNPPAIGGLLLSNLFLVALVTFDLRQRGRLHPVTLWGGAVMLLSEPLRPLIGATDAWRGLAATMIG